MLDDPTNEHVVAEGLAEVFAAELYGDAGYTHFVAQSTRTDAGDILQTALPKMGFSDGKD